MLTSVYKKMFELKIYIMDLMSYSSVIAEQKQIVLLWYFIINLWKIPRRRPTNPGKDIQLSKSNMSVDDQMFRGRSNHGNAKQK